MGAAESGGCLRKGKPRGGFKAATEEVAIASGSGSGGWGTRHEVVRV